MDYYQKIKKFLMIDIRDVFFFGGLSMLMYGLFLWKGLWLMDIVCGPLFMIIGYFMGSKPADKQVSNQVDRQ